MRLLFSALGAELPKGSLLYFVLPQLEPQSDAPRLVLTELFLPGLVSQFLQLDLFILKYLLQLVCASRHAIIPRAYKGASALFLLSRPSSYVQGVRAYPCAQRASHL